MFVTVMMAWSPAPGHPLSCLMCHPQLGCHTHIPGKLLVSNITPTNKFYTRMINRVILTPWTAFLGLLWDNLCSDETVERHEIVMFPVTKEAAVGDGCNL